VDHFKNERSVSVERALPSLGMAINHSRRALDICDQKRNHSAWKLGHGSAQVTP
jgi:hypothetical protein